MEYRIRIEGHLSHKWSDWFDGYSIVPEENGQTLLIGQESDQAALHGVIHKIRDLGMTLISITSNYKVTKFVTKGKNNDIN